MSDATEEAEEAPKKKSKLPLLLGFVLAIVGGGGGFFAASMGLIPGLGGKESVQVEGDSHATAEAHAADSSGYGAGAESQVGGFIPVDTVIVTLPSGGPHQHLRFGAQLEVNPAYVSEVEAQMPRIIDAFNTYLRAVDISDLQDQAALTRIRSHLLARMQIVTGPDRVRDVLVMEFVLS